MAERGDGTPRRKPDSGDDEDRTGGAPVGMTAEQVDQRELPGVERLLTLSDGVVAIAITLIVLQLKVPDIEHANSASELASALSRLGGELISYVVAFYVVAQFWLAHHRVFRMVRGHTEGLAWVNFVFLFTITTMPFTSNLVGTYGNNPVAIDIFGANLLAASLSTSLVIVYGRMKHVLRPEVRHIELVRGLQRSAALVVIVVCSMAAAWFSPAIARYFWIGLIGIGIFFRRMGLSDTSNVNPA